MRSKGKPAGPTMCRYCRAAEALPGDDACEACGQQVLARVRANVDAWVAMAAQKVRDLELAEQRRRDPT